ncbi:hypothetical protein LAZ67_X001842 [Cordylochernes scorpioides]|uniref:Reverse transcriptase domain-containing protein n=1 Tax=Cordylochernes scorpioides TaxID=51811 RepID=A0ABY6LTA3_9ARAC|nr:hypothetical protein LAZ67_X001842 [Cordylochernes scorpioides]
MQVNHLDVKTAFLHRDLDQELYMELPEELRLINEVLQGLDFAYAYIDDVLIASDSENQHVSHLQQLLGRLRDYGLTINETKCTFGQPSVKFLGFIITNARISPDPQRVQAIKDIPIPDTVGKL